MMPQPEELSNIIKAFCAELGLTPPKWWTRVEDGVEFAISVRLKIGPDGQITVKGGKA